MDRRLLGGRGQPGSASGRATAAFLPRIRDPRAFIGSSRNSPFGSLQHGNWAHTDGHEFAFTFIQDLINALGNFQGTLKVRAKITLIGRDELVGVASGQICDAAGNLIFNSCGTVRHRAARPTVPEHSVA